MNIRTCGVVIFQNQIQYSIVEFNRTDLEIKSEGVIYGRFAELEIQNKLKKIIKVFNVDIIAIDNFNYSKEISEFVLNHKKYFAVKTNIKQVTYIRLGISTRSGQIITKIDGKFVEANMLEATIKAVIYSSKIENNICLAIIAKEIKETQG